MKLKVKCFLIQYYNSTKYIFVMLYWVNEKLIQNVTHAKQIVSIYIAFVFPKIQG